MMPDARALILASLCLVIAACGLSPEADPPEGAGPEPSTTTSEPASTPSESAPAPACGETFPLFPTLVPGAPPEAAPEGRTGPGPGSLPAGEGQLVAHWEGDFGVVLEMRWPGTPYLEDTGGGEDFQVAGHPAYLAPYSPDPEEHRHVVQVFLSSSPDPCALLSADAYGPVPDAARDAARAFAEGLRPRSELEEHRAALRRAEAEARTQRLCVPPPADPGPGEAVVEVHQLCEGGGGLPIPLQATERVVAATGAPLRAALVALFSGPTPAEAEAGFRSWFSEATADALRELDLGPDGLAVIDLEAAPIRGLDNLSTATGGASFRAQILGTAFGFPTVEAVEVRLGGDPAAFCGLFELVPDCNPTTRAGWAATTREAPTDDPDLPTPPDRELAAALVGFARDRFPERARALPLAERVWLGLGTELLVRRQRAELGDPEAWTIDVEHYAGYVGPFSALDELGRADDLQISVGPHPHCASPPRPPPEAVADFRRVSVQPSDPGGCLGWWTVDLFVGPAGEIETVTLDLWEP